MKNPDALRYSPEMLTIWQREHRNRKITNGKCAENGCHNDTTGYRCTPCRAIHAAQQRARQQRKRA